MCSCPQLSKANRGEQWLQVMVFMYVELYIIVFKFFMKVHDSFSPFDHLRDSWWWFFCQLFDGPILVASKVAAAGLSTLPDNPGDSRFWMVSPGLQICLLSPYFEQYVCNLLDNCPSLLFFMNKILNVQHCFSYCLIDLNDSLPPLPPPPPHWSFEWSLDGPPP